MTLEELQDVIRESKSADPDEDTIRLFSSPEFMMHMILTMDHVPEPMRTSIIFALGYEAGLVMGKRKAEIESLERLC